MEGGIAIFLLVVIILIAGGALLAFTGLGSAIGLRQGSEDKHAQDPDSPPVHKRPTTPYHEHTRGIEPDDRGGQR